MGEGKGRVDRWGKREASQREEEGGREGGGGGRAPREQLAEVSVRSGELLGL